MSILTGCFLFFIGLVIGSFVNVCIHRIPRDESITTPRSRCPRCHTPIRWYDNIPLLSFLLLGGKCRACGDSISWRYPLVELTTGLAFLAIALHHPPGIMLPAYLYFTFVLIAVTGIDLEHQVIPDIFSFSLIAVGVLFSPFNESMGTGTGSRLLHSLAGGATGFGILFLIAVAGEKIMRQEAMGGGDIKLLAGVGTFIGFEKVFSTLFIASLAGSIIGFALLASKRLARRQHIPFGPFLAVAGYLNLFLPGPWSWFGSSFLPF